MIFQQRRTFPHASSKGNPLRNEWVSSPFLWLDPSQHGLECTFKGVIPFPLFGIPFVVNIAPTVSHCGRRGILTPSSCETQCLFSPVPFGVGLTVAQMPLVGVSPFHRLLLLGLRWECGNLSRSCPLVRMHVCMRCVHRSPIWYARKAIPIILKSLLYTRNHIMCFYTYTHRNTPSHVYICTKFCF